MKRMVLLTTFAVLAAGLGEAEANAQKKPKNPNAPKQKVRKPRVIRGQIQLRPGGAVARFYSPNPLSLLRNPKVQEELKLDDDQKTEAAEAIKELNKSRREGFQKLRGLKGQKRLKKSRENRKKYAADSTKKAKEILEPKQYARLQEILVQIQGTRALQNPEIQKKLKVTAEQKDKFRDVQKSGVEKRSKILKDLRANGGRIDFRKYREKSQEVAKEVEKKTLEVLTKAQREQFAKMKGKKFDLGRRGRLRALPVPGAPRIQIRRIPANKIRVRRIQRKAVKPGKARKAKPVE
ncbi:MAG: hypothetical protein ACE5KM_12580 [Planctomycetaceae bacterium]